MVRMNYRSKADQAALCQKVMPDIIKKVKEDFPTCPKMILEDLEGLIKKYGDDRENYFDMAAKEHHKKWQEKAKKASSIGADSSGGLGNV